MAYTAPTTLGVGDLVTTDIFNEYTVDNVIAVRAGVVDFIHIVDQKTAGTDGGTFTSGAWQTRDLNTELIDTGGHASVGSNQITLEAGIYKIMAQAPASNVDFHRLRLWNVTDSAVISLYAPPAYASSGAFETQNAFLSGQFTITAQKVLELQHRCSTTKTANGFGVQINWQFSVPEEFYASVMLQRIADA
jgi:hypothetical protein